MPLTVLNQREDTENYMQVSFNNAAAVKATSPTRRLADLREGEAAVIESIDLPADFALRLMELGFLPA